MLALPLAQLFAVPGVELDEPYLGAAVTPKPDAEFPARRSGRLRAAVVADGNYGRVRLLWPRATTIVWLNYSFQRVLLRALRRTLGRLITREPLWHGNKESVRLQFFSRKSILLWVINTFHRRRNELAGLRASGRYPHLSWVELRRPGDAEPYLKSLQPTDVRD